jgi:deoxyadenosine/deoxycytidine kinase
MGSSSSHFVFIEGNIGVGKSELLDALESKGYTVVKEAIEEDWTLFEKNCDDPARWGTAFQMQVTNSITNRMEAAIKGNSGKWPIFVERSIVSAYLFAKVNHDLGHLTHDELKVIREISLKLNDRFKSYISRTIYLECPLDECLRRIKQRSRSGEDDITSDYLSKLSDAYVSAREAGWISIDASQSRDRVLEETIAVIQ